MTERAGPSEAAILAAVDADKVASRHIQGFAHGTAGSSSRADPPFYAIRDFRKRLSDRIWTGPAITKEDREAFERQCKIERMRFVLEAYEAARPDQEPAS